MILNLTSGLLFFYKYIHRVLLEPCNIGSFQCSTVDKIEKNDYIHSRLIEKLEEKIFLLDLENFTSRCKKIKNFASDAYRTVAYM